MNKEEYWIALIKRNPSFQGEYVKISTKSLKAIIFQAHEKGSEMALNNDKKTVKDNKMSELDCLKSLFGIK